jgi:hypothetical protein
MPIPVAAVTGLFSLGASLIDRIIPDQVKRDEAKLKLIELESNGELTKIGHATAIIKAEAESESWLARNWRPMIMVTFASLIVARWLGWAAPNLQPEEYIKLWDIVEFGLGGYVVGRSGEKIAKTAAQAFVATKQ